MKGTQHAMSESETYAGVPFWRNSFMVQSLTGATVRAWCLSYAVKSMSHGFGIEATTAPRRQGYATKKGALHLRMLRRLGNERHAQNG